MLPDLQDTIVALATAPGPGARAVVRLSGRAALRIASTVCRVVETPQPGRRECRDGEATLPGVAAPLPCTLYSWPAPRTYTGQDVAELHTISCPPLLDL